MDRTIDFSGRHRKCSNPLLRKLFKIILDKRTNLCLAADKMQLDRLLVLLEKVGPHICILKIHCEMISGDPDENLKTLYEYKKRYNFLLFQDRKFHDGAETVQEIYAARYVKYVDIVTLFPEMGDDIFEAIRRGVSSRQDLPGDEPRGCVAVCELSFRGARNSADPSEMLAVAERNSDICIGIVAQKLQLTDRNNMIKASPGVNLFAKTDGKDQQWRNPAEVLKDGADILIVGRGITSAPENQWESLAIKYKEFCFGTHD